LVVIDEAYHEFAGDSVVPLLAECEGLAAHARSATIRNEK
jgi:histidinol-phosphate/aromatic aminotransferase/cobyric acid decarboxylase-like protein